MYVSVCVCVYKPTGVFVYSHLHTHQCAYRVVKQGGRQYTITHYICYSRHVHACLHLGTNAEPCTALVAAMQAAVLLGEPQAGRQQVGREQANNCQQRGHWGRCWWVVRPSLRVAWACSAPNLPCRAVIENKQDMVRCGKAWTAGDVAGRTPACRAASGCQPKPRPGGCSPTHGHPSYHLFYGLF